MVLLVVTATMAYTELQCMMGRMSTCPLGFEPGDLGRAHTLLDVAQSLGLETLPGSLTLHPLSAHWPSSSFFSKMNRLDKVGVIWCVFMSHFFR